MTLRTTAIKEGLISQGAYDEANDGAGRNRGEDGVAAVIIMDPVIAIRRFIQAPIIVVPDDDRIGVVTVMAANPVSRYVVGIVHEAESRPRVVIEWSVTTIVERARRIVPEIVAAVMPTIVIAIAIAIVAVEVPVMSPVTIVPIVTIVAVVAMIAIMAMIAPRLIVTAII